MAAAEANASSRGLPLNEQLAAACRTPDVVRDCELELVLEAGATDTRNKVASVARQFVPSWKDLDVSDFNVVQLQGGVTNVLHLVSLSAAATGTGTGTRIGAGDESDSPQAVLVRVFGANTEEIIDRERDHLSLRFLAQEGIGVPYFGRFRNGRIEGFLAGAKTLSAEDLCEKAIAGLIAQSVARFHGVSLPGLFHGRDSMDSAAAEPLPNLIWERLEGWLGKAEAITFPATQAKAAAVLAGMLGGGGLRQMRREIDWMRAATAVGAASRSLPIAPADLVRTARAEDSAGQAAARERAAAFLHETVFCHNDLIGANMLLVGEATSDPVVRLVDVEYSGPNPRAMDIANHFCEFAGLEFCFKERYPASLEAKMAFLRPYVEASGPELATWVADAAEAERSAFWEECARQADEHALAAHAKWGLWSLVQARWSTVEFDFMEYARLRWEAGYVYQKRLLFPHTEDHATLADTASIGGFANAPEAGESSRSS